MVIEPKKLLLFTLGLLFLGSCTIGYTLKKRHYRHGFYFQTAKSHKEPKAPASKNQVLVKHAPEKVVVDATIADGSDMLRLKPRFIPKDLKPGTVYPFNTSPKQTKTKLRQNNAPAIHQYNKAEPWKRTRAEKAKRKSRFYLFLGLAFLIVFLLGVSDHLLIILFAFFFLILSLINLFRKRKYRRLDKNVSPETVRQKEIEQEIRRAKRLYRTFLVLSLLLILPSLFSPVLVLFSAALILIALIFRAWWRQLELKQKAINSPQDPDYIEKERLDKTEGKKASQAAWLAFLGLFMILLPPIMFLAPLILQFSVVGYLAGLFIIGVFLTLVVGFVLFREKGKVALEEGKKILARHPNERFFPYSGRAKFARFMGNLSRWAWLVTLVYYLLSVLLILSLSFGG